MERSSWNRLRFIIEQAAGDHLLVAMVEEFLALDEHTFSLATVVTNTMVLQSEGLDLSAGQGLGPYRPESVLGRGGMETVTRLPTARPGSASPSRRFATPSHASSPEQCEGVIVDARADLHARGCLVEEVLLPGLGPASEACATAKALCVQRQARDPAQRSGYASDVYEVLVRLGAAQVGGRLVEEAQRLLSRSFLQGPRLQSLQQSLATLQSGVR